MLKSVLYLKFRDLSEQLNGFPFEHTQFISRMTEGNPAFVDIELGRYTSLTTKQVDFLSAIEGVSVRLEEVQT